MSGEEAPRLLMRDRDQLNDVATAIREGRKQVVFIVCEAQFRSVTLDYLRAQTQQSIPEPVDLVEPEQTLQALTEIEKLSPTDMRSLHVVHTALDVVRTLNWHREKLRRGGTILLWIEGVEGLRVLRQLGPDAYSFRDTMVIIQGETPVAVVHTLEESLDVQLARLRYSAAETPVERAEAAADLVTQLRKRDLLLEARLVVNVALQELASVDDTSERSTKAQAKLLVSSAFMHGPAAQRYRWFKKCASKLETFRSSNARYLHTCLLSEMPSPLGMDWRSVLGVQAELEKMHGWSDAGVAPFMLQAAIAWMIRGDMRRARGIIHDTPALRDGTNRAAAIAIEVTVHLNSGRLMRALEQIRKAFDFYKESSLSTIGVIKNTAQCQHLAGECEAARRGFEVVLQHHQYDVDARLAIADLHVETSRDTQSLSCAVSYFHPIIRDSISFLEDAHVFLECDAYVRALLRVHDSGCLTNLFLVDALAELDVAESVACSIAGDDPPWYSILFPALRAELLELRPETIEQAIALASTALERARTVFEDAVPKLARQLVHHLLQAGHLDRARAMLPAVIDEVAAVRHLRELARLRAYQIVTLVRLDAPISDVDAAVRALRETFDEMDAPRIAADTLLELAELLPPASKHVDAYALADEASYLYADMPYPFQEARALEVMGDVLIGRGEAEEAMRCYRSSRGICERFGFGLRMPLLDQKIAATAASQVKP